MEDYESEYNGKSFRFEIFTFGKSRTNEEKISLVNEFRYMKLNGKINLKDPEVRFTLSEDLSPVTKSDLPGEKLHKVYFSRFLAEASRDVVQLYDLKKREYLGTTSMDAELSLVMSNMALVKKDSLVYDPFVGTGSFLVTSAHFGAYTLGSDIDGRQVRGKQGKSIQSNIKQYNFKDQILDTVVFDITHHPWRNQIQFDAIVTDPPYGVRAGAKKLGRKQGNRKLEDIALINGIPAHLNSDYLPPKVNYDMPQVLLDLLNFSANHLTVGGRITFWLPNIVENDEEPIIPNHPCLNLISDCEQAFHGWSRRLITMEKHKQPETPYVSEILSVDQSDIFRNKYFQPNKIE
ncbi:hypothetical protein K502DRAFT_326490 [Neoconidiobolus thromboides FSU 785]|nr:hypothetical protein K502DRAFT_326490 [Neoconidiobolus thromboides FSU 785]